MASESACKLWRRRRITFIVAAANQGKITGMCSLWLVSTVMALSHCRRQDSNSGLCIEVTESYHSNSTDNNVNCNRLDMEILQECSECVLLIFNLYIYIR